MDATTNLNAEEDLLLKDEALFILFESADNCISAVTFNAVFAELICFFEVTGSNANNAKAWCETVSVEDTWTFAARDWTQLVNAELRLERIVEKGTQADEKLCGLTKRNWAFWFVIVVACEYTLLWQFETSVLEDWLWIECCALKKLAVVFQWE